MKCVLCGRRKGKRFCPARQALICGQCCGEKRVVEIACPADCSFLSFGQSYRWLKKYLAILDAEKDPARKQRIYEATRNQSESLAAVERALILAARQTEQPTDQELADCIEVALETCRTEQRGVLYEHQSTNPRVAGLNRGFREALEAELSKMQPRPQLEGLTGCLEVAGAGAAFHAGREGDESYLEFIRRNHPDLAADQPDRGIIIASR